MKGKPLLYRGALAGLLVLALALALAAVGCSSAKVAGYRGTVKGSGSTTLLPVAQEAAAQFTAANPATRVDIQGGGSSVGVTQVEQGVVNIGCSSRDLNPGEGKGLVDFKVAYDIIALIVNPQNPVRNLDNAQVKGIFTGKITNWKTVGGPDKDIVVVVRDLASGTRDMFDKKALGSTPENPVLCEPQAIESSSNGVVRQVISTTDNAIGYISYGYVNKLVKPISFNGVAPTVPNASSGKYTMARYLHMFTKGQPSGAVEGYIDFTLSDRFQREIVATEYIPVKDVPKQ